LVASFINSSLNTNGLKSCWLIKMSFYLVMIVTNATITGPHSVNHIFAKSYDDVKGITGVA
ncbi:hypothetical protein NAI60_10000, partial [Francisella tularensis subsp. holarctica]|uniref:hypothetical protein n=1 Tax=Francisella tularensis TaxID=263 RepID=UPI002381C6C9